MGKLDKILDLTNAHIPERPGSVRDKTIEGMTQRFETIVHQLNVLLTALNNLSDQNEQARGSAKKSLSGIQDASGAMSDLSKSVRAEMSRMSMAMGSIEREVSGISRALAALPDNLPKGDNKDLKAVIAAVEGLPGKIPKLPSLDRIESQLRALMEAPRQESLRPEINELLTRLAEIKVESSRPREWEFDFIYRRRGNRIEKVVATEVT